ncbi:hypothetical protein [Rhodococcus opacus]|nr:hypothetical protein [Rhodococcus opacus]
MNLPHQIEIIIEIAGWIDSDLADYVHTTHSVGTTMAKLEAFKAGECSL